jgi:hypothetical protein
MELYNGNTSSSPAHEYDNPLINENIVTALASKNESDRSHLIKDVFNHHDVYPMKRESISAWNLPKVTQEPVKLAPIVKLSTREI